MKINPNHNQRAAIKVLSKMSTLTMVGILSSQMALYVIICWQYSDILAAMTIASIGIDSAINAICILLSLNFAYPLYQCLCGCLDRQCTKCCVMCVQRRLRQRLRLITDGYEYRNMLFDDQLVIEIEMDDDDNNNENNDYRRLTVDVITKLETRKEDERAADEDDDGERDGSNEIVTVTSTAGTSTSSPLAICETQQTRRTVTDNNDVMGVGVEEYEEQQQQSHNRTSLLLTNSTGDDQLLRPFSPLETFNTSNVTEYQSEHGEDL